MLDLPPELSSLIAPMWTSHVVDAGRPGALRYSVSRNAEPASYAEVLEAWRANVEFCRWFNELLASSPFPAFRWETPPITKSTVGRVQVARTGVQISFPPRDSLPPGAPSIFPLAAPLELAVAILPPPLSYAWYVRRSRSNA